MQEGKYLKATIQDEGIGIPKEYLSKIFDPYFTTKQTGSGLGLTTSYSIVKKHRGYLTVESGLHKGTKFYIYLPATICGSDNVEKRNSTDIKCGQGRILVMDDKIEVREVAGAMLSYIGYQVGNTQKTVVKLLNCIKKPELVGIRLIRQLLISQFPVG